MVKKKSYFRKIIVINCIYVICMVSILIFFWLYSSISAEKKSAQEIQETFASKNASQMDDLIGDMEKVSYSVAASDEIVAILNNASHYKGSNNYFDSAQTERRRILKLLQLFSGSNLGSRNISIISTSGDYINLGLYNTLSYSRSEMMDLSRISTLSLPGSYKYLLPLGDDIYKRTPTPMFAFVRKISNEFGVYGYVEIQDSQKTLDEIFDSSSISLDITTVITYEDHYFYSSDYDQDFWANNINILKKNSKNDQTTKLNIMGKTYSLYSITLKNYDLTLYSLCPSQHMTGRLISQIFMIVLFGIMLILLICAATIAIHNYLYKPVLELRNQMNALPFNELQFDFSSNAENDEIELFHQAFKKMIINIRQQNEELLNRKNRELQISYQALQAQVSPHFLYNTLSVIGLKGEIGGCPEVMDMCSYLTKMMSYSLDTKTATVKLEQEIKYTQYYLHLMQYRYMEKLEYQLQIDDELTELSVPKFILQPIVENCFTHGFKNCTNSKYIIFIIGSRNTDGWQIRVEDNGSGFSEEDKQRTYHEARQAYECIKNPNADFVKNINGIGLVNTYARLLLGLPGFVRLQIDTSSLGGGSVEIQYLENIPKERKIQ